jgi:hypothetical protein
VEVVEVVEVEEHLMVLLVIHHLQAHLKVILEGMD